MILLRRFAPVLACAAFMLSGCALLSSSGSKSLPAPTTGTDVIQRMFAKYEGKWFQTMQFTQINTRYLPTGRTERGEWKEYMLVPGRLRIEFMPASGGNGAIYADGSVYSFEGGRLARTTAQVNILLVLTADVYAQPTSTSSRQLAALGVDLTKLRRDTWTGRRVWVVGSTGNTDLASSQFWVDAETWVVLRVIDRAPQVAGQSPRPATEYQLSDYRTLSGVPVVHQILFLRDGKQFFKEEYTMVELNTPLDARLFSTSQWRVPARSR